MNALDERFFHACYGGRPHDALTLVMIGFTLLGSGWTMILLAPLLFAAKTRRFAVALLAVFSVTAVVVFATKFIVRRVRPCASLSGVHALWGGPTDYSFPSGHAAGGFAFALFVTTLCFATEGSDLKASQKWLLSALAIVAAVGIALSRVYLGVHYPTDVAGGAVIGGALGFAGARRVLAMARSE